MDDNSKDSGAEGEASRISKLLHIAKERFQLAYEAESDNRKEEIEDLKFLVGDQWPLDVKNQRALDSRPCLTINRIPQFVRQITNDQRQNRPSIKINSVDDKADIETAKIFQGIIRHIEYNSHADIAYDTGFEGAAKTGLGYWRLVTEYQDAMSFQQEIKIKRIKDRFSVYLDPFYTEPDGSDSEWGFVFEEMSEDEFKEQYPDSKASKMSDWSSIGDASSDWIKKGTVRVAEYFYKVCEPTDVVLVLDHDGKESVLEKSKLPKDLPQGMRVVRERKAMMTKVKWAKINGLEVLEETELPGEWIPIIPVIGEEEIVDGKKILSGLVRHIKDPQRMYNYMTSAEAETIALAPRVPFIGAEGQFEGHEEEWKTANTRNHAYLEYKQVDLRGQQAPAPVRQVFEPAVQAISQSRAQYGEEMKATSGIYDASLGNKSNEQSGIAIQRRNAQSQTSNFHFMDNLSRSLRHTGRILVNWIPKVYDTPQVIRVIGEDGEVDMVKVNQLFTEGGEEKGYFLDHGRYDVTVDTGPSFQTKRQEAVASMLDLVRSAPQTMQAVMDLLVRNMDWPGAQEIAERLKKLLPPNLQDDDKDGQQVPPEAQQKLAQMQQMIQMLSQHLEENSKIIESKKLELDNKLQIATLQAETQLKVELLKHDAKDGQLAFQEEMREIQHMRDTLSSQLQSLNNGLGGDPSAGGPSNNTQPTGGSSPGQPMGEMP